MMSEEKCYLADFLRLGGSSLCNKRFIFRGCYGELCKCVQCANIICISHCAYGDICHKCKTLQDGWVVPCDKEFYEQIYPSMTKAYRQ